MKTHEIEVSRCKSDVSGEIKNQNKITIVHEATKEFSVVPNNFIHRDFQNSLDFLKTTFDCKLYDNTTFNAKYVATIIHNTKISYGELFQLIHYQMLNFAYKFNFFPTHIQGINLMFNSVQNISRNYNSDNRCWKCWISSQLYSNNSEIVVAEDA